VTEAEQAFLQYAPNGLGAGIRTLARHDEGMARLFVEQAAPVIASELTQVILNDLLFAVEQAAALHEHAYGKQLLAQIERPAPSSFASTRSLHDRYGNPQTLLTYYQGLVEEIKGRRYLTSAQAHPGADHPAVSHVGALLDRGLGVSGGDPQRHRHDHRHRGLPPARRGGLPARGAPGAVPGHPPGRRAASASRTSWSPGSSTPLMFGPTARVAIEDAYSGAVRVVDNVPLGPAAVGSLMSNVGYGVSRLFEQAFSTPAMTDTGFADPLQTLMSVRKGTLSRIALGSGQQPHPGGRRGALLHQLRRRLHPLRRRHRHGARSTTSCATRLGDGAAERAERPHHRAGAGAQSAAPALRCAWTALSEYTTVEFIPALTRQPPGPDAPRRPGDVLNKVQLALDASRAPGWMPRTTWS
jgi:hypothetical protein